MAVSTTMRVLRHMPKSSPTTATPLMPAGSHRFNQPPPLFDCPGTMLYGGTHASRPLRRAAALAVHGLLLPELELEQEAGAALRQALVGSRSGDDGRGLRHRDPELQGAARAVPVRSQRRGGGAEDRRGVLRRRPLP